MNFKNKFIILLFLLTIVSKYVCENDVRVTHFVMRTFSETDEELTTYNLKFDYTTYLYENYDFLFNMYELISIFIF